MRLATYEHYVPGNSAQPEQPMSPTALLEEVARSELAEQGPRKEARDRFYPGWWMYLHLRDAGEDDRPFYRVVCASDEEALLADAARPSFVEAEIVVSPDP